MKTLTIGRETVIFVKIPELMHHGASNPGYAVLSWRGANAVHCVGVDSNNFLAKTAIEVLNVKRETVVEIHHQNQPDSLQRQAILGIGASTAGVVPSFVFEDLIDLRLKGGSNKLMGLHRE